MSRDASNRLSAGARRAELKLLAPPARPTTSPYVPSPRPPRRPGERREPLPLRVSRALASAGAARGLDVGCAVEICLERALLIADLDALGRLQLYDQLLATAATAPVRHVLPPAKARYLQMLVAARDRDPTVLDPATRAGEVVVDVPLRLFPRVTAVASEIACAEGDELSAALTLEIAATSDGRTMTEWASLSALRLSL